MGYRQVICYVMSGTGNTRRVALWMQAMATRVGVTCQVVSYEKAEPTGDIAGEDTELVGLFFPTHGLTAPWSMLKFAWRLPRRQAHACVVATRGGTMFGRVCLPGLEGTACYLIALLLALKGYRVRGVLALDMPSNWTLLHWGMNAEHVAALLGRAQPRAESFMARLLSGQRSFGGYLSLALGLALARLSCMYLLIARVMLAKLFFANTACNGCGICVRACPQHAIRLFGHRHPRPYWTFSCESCMRCMNYCPRRAVEGGQSWAVLLGYLTGIPLIYTALVYAEHLLSGQFAWTALALRLSTLPALAQHLLSTLTRLGRFLLVDYPNILLAAWLAYWLFYLLLRIPVVNLLFTYTTFTHAYRRYHEPETSLCALAGDEDDSLR